MNEVAIFHLVRKANGFEPLKDFLKSWEAAPPNGNYRLVFILKGFAGSEDEAPYRKFLEALRADFVSVSDEGFDISAYFQAAEKSSAEVLLFFNSFSVLLQPGWFEGYLKNWKDDVGMIGATASLESPASSYWDVVKAQPFSLKKILRCVKAVYQFFLFPPFPNVHLRTNAIMVRRRDFLETKRRIPTKMHALRFESGWAGLSRSLEKKGLKLLLLSKGGEAFEVKDWCRPEGFRMGRQKSLLVADNQTRSYDAAPDALKLQLSQACWGKR